eukprot:1704995-Pyramimonas_sp.AAC.2
MLRCSEEKGRALLGCYGCQAVVVPAAFRCALYLFDCSRRLRFRVVCAQATAWYRTRCPSPRAPSSFWRV